MTDNGPGNIDASAIQDATTATNNFTTATTNSSRALGDRNKLVNEAHDLIRKLGSSLDDASQKMKGMTEFGPLLSSLGGVFTGAKNAAADFSNMLGITSNQIKNTSINLQDTVYTLGALTNILPTTTKLFGDLGNIGEETGFGIAHSFHDIEPIISAVMGLGGKMGTVFSGAFKNLATSASSINDLQTALFQATAASGQLPLQ